MQARLMILCLLVLGCSRGTDPEGRPLPPRVNGVVPPVQPERNVIWDNTPPPAERLYEGQPVSVWVEQFNQPEDAALQAKAGAVLGQLGKEGFQPLLEGMKSNSDDRRILALQSVTKETLAEHQKETWPILRNMLGDPNPAIRRQATERISWYGVQDLATLKETVRLLRLLAQSDPDFQVRQAAESALFTITTAYTGRPVAGAPDDPKLPF